jgi:hypothetical protein
VVVDDADELVEFQDVKAIEPQERLRHQAPARR